MMVIAGLETLYQHRVSYSHCSTAPPGRGLTGNDPHPIVAECSFDLPQNKLKSIAKRYTFQQLILATLIPTAPIYFKKQKLDQTSLFLLPLLLYLCSLSGKRFPDKLYQTGPI